MAGTQIARELDQNYERTFRRLGAFFRARGVAADEASDLAQETAFKVWVHLKRHGRSRDDLDPLIYRIAKNVLAEHWRTRGPNAEPVGEENTKRFATSDGIAHVESRLQASWMMEDLTGLQRRAMAMFIEGFKPGDIARELGIKRNAVDQLLHRAKRSLATSLKQRAFAGLALLPARLRLRLREWYASVAGGPLGESGASQLIALATVSLAATLTFLSPAEAPSTEAPGDSSAQVTSARTTLDRGASGPLGSASHGVGTRSVDDGSVAPGSGENDDEVDVDVRKHRVGIKKSVDDGKGGEFELIEFETEHRPGEEGERGTIGPLLDDVTNALCNNAPAACS